MMSSGNEGVVVFSLGTYINKANRRIDEMLALTFSKLPCKVLWKHSNAENLPVSSNVRIQKWLPLNDILGKFQSWLTIRFKCSYMVLTNVSFPRLPTTCMDF